MAGSKIESLCDIFARWGRDTDKNTDHSYGPVYEKLLAPFRESADVVLELGVDKGGSLRVWHDYFVKALIIGVDNNPQAMIIRRGRILTYCVNLASTDELARQLLGGTSLNSIDVIIDDGSHLLGHQLGCLMTLWRFLKPGGIYCIEDASSLAEGEYEKLNASWGLPPLKLLYDARVKNNRHDDVIYCFEKPTQQKAMVEVLSLDES